jgi:hypothetical protein
MSLCVKQMRLRRGCVVIRPKVIWGEEIIHVAIAATQFEGHKSQQIDRARKECCVCGLWSRTRIASSFCLITSSISGTALSRPGLKVKVKLFASFGSSLAGLTARRRNE